MFKQVLTILLIIIISIAAIVFFPIFTIMALNTLFGLGIAVNFYTWLSIVWIQMVTFGSIGYQVQRLREGK